MVSPLATLLAPLLLAPVDPVRAVGSCRTADDLQTTLTRMARATDEPHVRGFLWGSLLYEGCRDRKRPFPQTLADAGERMSALPVRRDGTAALQLWWRSTIGGRYAMPNFKDEKVEQWINVVVNGKYTRREPVYYSPSEDRQTEVRNALKARLLRSQSKDDGVLLYRWWQSDDPRQVSDADVASVAADATSPFQAFGIAEMAIREEQARRPGVWTKRWNATKAQKPTTLAVRSLVQREREALANRKP